MLYHLVTLEDVLGHLTLLQGLDVCPSPIRGMILFLLLIGKPFHLFLHLFKLIFV